MNEKINSHKLKETFEFIEEILSKYSIIKSKWIFKQLLYYIHEEIFE